MARHVDPLPHAAQLLTFVPKCGRDKLVWPQPNSEITIDSPRLTVSTSHGDSVEPEHDPSDVGVDRNLDRVGADHEEQKEGDERLLESARISSEDREYSHQCRQPDQKTSHAGYYGTFRDPRPSSR